MNWKTIEAIARSHSEDPKRPQFYYNIQGISDILGSNRDNVSAFLREQSVPPYSVGKSKIYFLPDVIEAIERTRWVDLDERGKKIS